MKLWSLVRPFPLWTGPARTDTQPQASKDELATKAAPLPVNGHPLAIDSVCCMDLDADRGFVTAGTQNGFVYVFSDLDVASMLSLPLYAWERDAQSAKLTHPRVFEDRRTLAFLDFRVLTTHVLLASDKQSLIDELFLDAGESADTATPIAHREGAPRFEFFRIQWTVPAVLHSVLMPPTDTVAGQVTCIRVEFSELKASDSVASSSLVAPTSSSGLVLGPSPRALRNLNSGHFAEKRFLCARTSDGKLLGWRLPSFEELASSELVTWVYPSFSFDFHHTALTSVDFTPRFFSCRLCRRYGQRFRRPYRQYHPHVERKDCHKPPSADVSSGRIDAR